MNTLDMGFAKTAHGSSVTQHKILSLTTRGLRPCAFAFLFALASSSAFAQGTAFTYQGRLNDTNGPVTSIYDLRFTLYDQLGGASNPISVPGVGITNGLFTVTVDFGNLFNGEDRSLEIAARPYNTGAFVTLSPRQSLLPSPYAIFANTASNLSGILPASRLSGTLANSLLPPNPNFSGTVAATAFSGSGASLTSINASSISSGTLADARLSTNVALRAGGNTFTNAQLFNGAINLNSSGGFGQSSAGNFYIDAPFIAGGRFAVLENGNVGIGTASPSQKFQVNGSASVSALTVNGAATVNGTINLPATAIVNAGADTLLRSDANQNFFAGSRAGKNATNTVNNNTAVGYQAFFQGTNSQFNTALGDLALYSDTLGSFNTAEGALVLYSNTTGGHNTANGCQALYSNTSGSDNFAAGYQALYSNTAGSKNTAGGSQALFSNTASYNTAYGYQALYYNTNGTFNTADGNEALWSNTSGYENTAMGDGAAIFNTTGNYNTALGAAALHNNATGSGNIALGYSAGFYLNGNDNIDIGHEGLAADNDTIRIGSSLQQTTYIAGIYGKTVANSASVYIAQDGQLGTLTSSARYKQNIEPMGEASEVLLGLKPVTFEYKPHIDPLATPQFGLIAEEVEKVDPDLVVHDQEHGIYTVRYEAVNAMLLNEFLKEHQKIEEQNAKIRRLEESMAGLKAMISRLAEREPVEHSH